MEYVVSVRSIDEVTHDVIRITTQKPRNYYFVPGQATEVSINKRFWVNKKRPFTFTCLPGDNYLEFTIKLYPSHKGVTNELQQLKVKDTLIIQGAFGSISYKGEGVFIAGGAGVTPFISILRSLGAANEIGDNCLVFGNKAKEDIILADEFKCLLGKNFINVLSVDAAEGYYHGFVTEDILAPLLNGKRKNVYLCGPELMMKAVERQLKRLRFPAESIVKEVF